VTETAQGRPELRLGAAARGFIAVTTVLAVVLTAFLLATQDLHLRSVAPLAVLLPATVVLERRAFRSPGGVLITPSDPFLLAASMLVGPAALFAMALPNLVTTPTPPPYVWPRRIFNFGSETLMLLAAAGAAHLAQRLPELHGGRQLLAALAALAAYRLSNTALVCGLLELCGRRGVLGEFLNLRETLIGLGSGSIAVTAALLYDQHLPVLAAFAFAPLLLVWDATRVPHLQAEARIDAKTGLLTPRALQERLEDELSGGPGRCGALLMADLDLLREVNNTHGHLAGDAVLRTVGETFLTTLRAGDVAGRFGGEEFCVLLPGAGREEAVDVAERLRQAVEQVTVLVPGRHLRVTISVGLALYPQAGAGLESLLERADAALYEAKGAGRNRVRLAA
jgi:diguanylate cyclase (GGDEF)-like protein